MSSKLTTQEAVMGQVIPKQHPSVVLRSHFKAVRALLIIALVAVCALAAAVVILAVDDEKASIAPKSATTLQQNPALQPDQALPAGTRFDGGPDEGTRGPQVSPAAPGTRFDGGPDEGTRGPQSYWQSSDPRSSYQPAPNDGTKARAGGPRFFPMGPSH
jgi:hypothetical protein